MFKLDYFSGGVYPKPNKNTLFYPTKRYNQFPVIRIPMSMHIGPPCNCIVKKGDQVLTGQVIGEPTEEPSVPIHSSVSGTVRSVHKEVASSGRSVVVVEIESDGQYTFHPDVKPPVIHNRQEFISALKDSGLVGLGGVGYPTYAKMRPPEGGTFDTLVINAADSEPYITADFRQCVDHPDEIIDGIRAVMRYLDIPVTRIGVEKNKPQAADVLLYELEKIKKTTGDQTSIYLDKLPLIYPQGAEKMLVYSLTGRKIPSGGDPRDVNVLVLNVSTVRFISKYLHTGIPLIRRRLTLDGSALHTPCNVNVPIGAPIPDVINAAGGILDEEKDNVKIILGGSMMGVALDRAEASVIKYNRAILAFGKKEAEIPPETVCIRCARCLKSCPMDLVPTTLDKMARVKDVEGLEQYHVHDCIECGCCAYVCPAKRYLVQSIRNGKTYVNQDRNKEEIDS